MGNKKLNTYTFLSMSQTLSPLQNKHCKLSATRNILYPPSLKSNLAPNRVYSFKPVEIKPWISYDVVLTFESVTLWIKFANESVGN